MNFCIWQTRRQYYFRMKINLSTRYEDCICFIIFDSIDCPSIAVYKCLWAWLCMGMHAIHLVEWHIDVVCIDGKVKFYNWLFLRLNRAYAVHVNKLKQSHYGIWNDVTPAVAIADHWHRLKVIQFWKPNHVHVYSEPLYLNGTTKISRQIFIDFHDTLLVFVNAFIFS